MRTMTYVVDAVDTVTAKISLVMKAQGGRRAHHQQAWEPAISWMPALRVADIYKTKVCPLAKVMRRGAEKTGREEIKGVYSEEQPTRPLEDMGISCRTNCICPPGAKHKCTGAA